MHQMSDSFKVSPTQAVVRPPDGSLTGSPPRLHPGRRRATYLAPRPWSRPRC